MRPGAFTFVLHSHLPWVRKAGRWPFGEEWLYQALLDTYIPLADVLTELDGEGIQAGVTLGVTPVLIEMLRDPYLLDQFDAYLDERIAATCRDIIRFDAAADPRAALAQWYLDRFERLKERWYRAYERDIIGVFRRLAQRGALEVITCAATHGYLPLFATDSSIVAQLRTGIETTRAAFGIDPVGIWLPECAYRGAYIDEHGTRRAGIDEFLAELGIAYFFTDAQAITGAQRVGRAPSSGAMLSEFALLGHHESEAGLSEVLADEGRTTLLPYRLPNSGVAAFARNQLTSLQVWSRQYGYPGDGAYREFHKRDDHSGNQYWRVTSDESALGDKALYDPATASARSAGHAAHFAQLVGAILSSFEKRNPGVRPMLAAPFDAELFGHWWSEGPRWIGEVIRLLAQRSDVVVQTPAAYLRESGADHTIDLPESSWGEAGDHRVWYNAQTAWIWPIVHECERRMEALVAAPKKTPQRERALAQAARELLLLQSSDWPFLITTGQAKEYAVERFNLHVARFRLLADALQRPAGMRNVKGLEASYLDDTLFAEIDPALFARRNDEKSGLLATPRPLIASLP